MGVILIEINIENLPLTCQRCITKQDPVYIKHCENFLNCIYRKDHKANTVINIFKDYKEIVHYKNHFPMMKDLEPAGDVDRSRKFVYDDVGLLHPLYDNLKINALQKTLQSSRNRAVNNLYGYALSNDWNYFITLTIDPKKGIDRFSREDITYHWQLFRQRMQYHFPKIKIIIVNEPHKNGALHIHGVIGNVNLDKYLSLAVNCKRKSNHYLEPLKQNGRQIYNLDTKLYDYGFVTLTKIEDKKHPIKVFHYLIKYISKDSGNIAYNKKCYYHTHNLDFKNSMVSNLTSEEVNSMLPKIDLLNKDDVYFKETKNFVVYRFKT